MLATNWPMLWDFWTKSSHETPDVNMSGIGNCCFFFVLLGLSGVPDFPG